MVNPPSTPEEAAARCDVPMYPGAKAPDGRSHMPKVDHDGNLHYDLVLTSTDPYKKVAEFYGRKMKLSVVAGTGSFSVVGKTPKGNDAIVVISPEDRHTLIQIRAIAYKGKGP